MDPRTPRAADEPAAGREERMLRHPAGALVCAAVIAGLAFVLASARTLPLLGGILATLAIGCVGPWIAVAGATVSIAWDRRRVRVGEAVTATLTRRSLVPGWRPRVAVEWPEARSTVEEGSGDRVTVVPDRRGVFPRRPPMLTSVQPFGVHTARRAIAAPDPVVVWPARAEVRVPAGLVAAAGAGRQMSERITGQGGDAIGARDYRAGDSVRSIHWAHTARRETLVVRERPGTAAACVRLVIDHRPTSDAVQEAESRRRLDAVIGIAFAIVESWHPQGVTFVVVWPGREPLAPRTPAEITTLLDELACLEPGAAAPVVPPRGRSRPVDLEILVTTPSGRASLAAAAGSAAHPRHERLWIVVGAESRPARRPRSGSPETFLHVPLEPDPIAAVDALVAATSHDPDVRRPAVAARC